MGTQNHPYSHTPSPITTPSDPESHHPPSSDESKPPHQPIVQKPRFQNVRFVEPLSMKLPTENTSYHTAREESTEIDPNKFLMQQPSNEKGPPIRRLHKTTPPGTEENPIDVDKIPSRKRLDTLSPTVGILYRTNWDPVITPARGANSWATPAKNVFGQDPSSVYNVAKQDT